MPNVIVELRQEMQRVRLLLSLLAPGRREEASAILEFARLHIAMNSYEGMRESIDDLKEFALPPVIPEGGSA